MSHNALVPVDGELATLAAVDYALSLDYDINITVIHVIPICENKSRIRRIVLPEAFDELQALSMASVVPIIEEAQSRATEQGTDLQVVTKYGHPASQITEYADKNTVDHIIMGSYSRKPLSRLLLGSILEGVIRRATIPVSIVNHRM